VRVLARGGTPQRLAAKGLAALAHRGSGTRFTPVNMAG
jgi:hypothetical protein